MRSSQANQMFTPPPQFHPQHQPQQLLNSYQSLPKFPSNAIGDMNSFNGNQPSMDMSNLSNHASKLTINEMISQPDLMDILKKSEKDIQFLQNVHFPEKQHLLAMNQMGQQPQGLKFPSMNFNSLNYGHLLPPNMSFYDIASQPKEIQYRWFIKLSETYGLEEADKFTELLRQVPSATAPNHADPVFNGIGDSSKNYMHLMDGHHQQHPSKVDNNIFKLHQPGQYGDSGSNKLFQGDDLDSIFMNSLQTRKMADGNLLKEMEMKQMTESMFQNNAGASHANERNILGIDLFNMSSKPMDVEQLDIQSPQRSVPLYLRKTQHRGFE